MCTHIGHTHADETQMYVSLNPIIHDDKARSMTRLAACLGALYIINKLGDIVSVPFNIGNNTAVPTSRVRNIGVIMVQHLADIYL